MNNGVALLVRETGPDGFALLKKRQAADALNTSVRTLDRLRARGEGPPVFWIGGQVRYPALSLAAWLIEQGLAPNGPEDASQPAALIPAAAGSAGSPR
jgi:hypothetical protein